MILEYKAFNMSTLNAVPFFASSNWLRRLLFVRKDEHFFDISIIIRCWFGSSQEYLEVFPWFLRNNGRKQIEKKSLKNQMKYWKFCGAKGWNWKIKEVIMMMEKESMRIEKKTHNEPLKKQINSIRIEKYWYETAIQCKNNNNDSFNSNHNLLIAKIIKFTA